VATAASAEQARPHHAQQAEAAARLISAAAVRGDAARVSSAARSAGATVPGARGANDRTQSERQAVARTAAPVALRRAHGADATLASVQAADATRVQERRAAAATTAAEEARQSDGRGCPPGSAEYCQRLRDAEHAEWSTYCDKLAAADQAEWRRQQSLAAAGQRCTPAATAAAAGAASAAAAAAAAGIDRGMSSPKTCLQQAAVGAQASSDMRVVERRNEPITVEPSSGRTGRPFGVAAPCVVRWVTPGTQRARGSLHASWMKTRQSCTWLRKSVCGQTVGRLGWETYRRNRDRLRHQRSSNPHEEARWLNVQSGQRKRQFSRRAVSSVATRRSQALKRCAARDSWAGGRNLRKGL
jgi:hypothetical protein